MDFLKIYLGSSFFDALLRLEKNSKRFLIVVDYSDKVLAVLTDGDIRRAFLSGAKKEASIDEYCNKNYKYISLTDDFSEVCEKFKKKGVDFLPIVNGDKRLINIITKDQFHVMMLENIKFDFYMDFSLLDKITVEHEIYSRPWGFYKSTLLTSHAQSKIITVFPFQALSLQEHSKREEHWIVIKGEGEMTLGESVFSVYPGKYLFIPKGCKHRARNTHSKDNLIFAEVQLGSYFGEDDIIRHEDNYGRI